jgi:toxin ParE1/3/4
MQRAEYRLSPKAINDLNNIWTYVSEHNELAADALLRRIRDRIGTAAIYPEIGAKRPRLGPKARILIEGSYVVVYEPADYGVYIVAIAHARRRPSHWLKDKNS